MRPGDRLRVVAACAPFLVLGAVAIALADRTAALVIAAVGTALLLLLSIHVRSYRNLLGRFADQESRRVQDLGTLYRQLEARSALDAVLETPLPLPPTRGWAISPDAGLALVRLVRQCRPRLVLELGSGTSTLLLGHAIAQLGRGKLVSLESDEDFARRTREAVRDHGLEQVVTVRTAPLGPLEVEGRSGDWYALSAVEGLEEIDLLVVDGPPGRPGELVRYPALPVLRPRLAARAAVFLDDTVRREERETVRRWLERFGEFDAEELDCEKGAVVLRRDVRPAS